MQRFSASERHKSRRGSATVELAISLPLLLSMFLGVWHFGYSYYIYNGLEQAVRAGARYASTRTYDSPNMTPSSAYLTAVQNVTVYGDPAGGTDPVVPGLQTNNVRVLVVFVKNVPAKVIVGISDYRIPGIFNNVTLTGKPATQFPYLGVWDPIP